MSRVTWDANDYKLVTSSLTGRRLVVNTRNDTFVIPPTFDSSKLRSTANAFLKYAHTLKPASRPNPKCAHLFEDFTRVDSLETFVNALDTLLKKHPRVSTTNDSARLPDFLGSLVPAGCLLWPRNYAKVLGRAKALFEIPWGFGSDETGPLSVLRLLESGAVARSQSVKTHTRPMLVQLILTVGGIQEVGDLVPEVIDGRFNDQSYVYAFHQTLLAVLRQRYSLGTMPFRLDDYRLPRKTANRSDDTFATIVLADETMSSWRTLSSAYLAKQTHDRISKRGALYAFLDFATGDPTFPRTPVHALESTFAFPDIPNVTTKNDPATARKKRALADFFDYILDTHCVEEGEDGFPYRIPGFRNPLASAKVNRSQAFETYREAMPPRYLRMLRDIIEENDFAWPKAFEEKRNRLNVVWRDAPTDEWNATWSPVCAYAVLLKLLLPLRTFQIRMLNSGEADTRKFDLRTGTWVANPHVLAQRSDPERPMGVLRAIRDNDSGRDRVGLYINTNKTADALKSNEARGYVIPWEHNEAITLLATLRDWQERYNPIHTSTAWSELDDFIIRKGYHKDILVERGRETFLFREPSSKRPDQPVTSARLNRFWVNLCAELERRLQSLGELCADGQPVKLVTRNDSGSPISAIYDLHSLRVSILTAFAEQGVPLDALMKIAGHCTAIMSLYYQKYSIGHITRVLNKAELERMADEQTNWERYLKSQAYEQLKHSVVWNDASGLHVLAGDSKSSWQRRDHGICPVGCSRCHEGGEALSEGGKKKYAPVPGGSRNCVRCRFFITGPAFLIGLHSYFNAISFRCSELSRRWQAAEKHFWTVDYERRRAMEAGSHFAFQAEWERASSTLDQCTRELDDVLLTFHASYRLIQQCQVLLNRPGRGSESAAFALLTVGTSTDIEYVLNLYEHGEREFELLDAVCHSAVWFASVDYEIPNLKRMRFFDNMLQRHGYDAAFVSLSEEDALRVGNELSHFMFTQYGSDKTNALVNGDLLLRDLGIAAEDSVLDFLEARTHRRPIKGAKKDSFLQQADEIRLR